MENEDVIREQMTDTRTSLTGKLENLEQQVTSSMQGATANVVETVDVVKDTIQETVATVKDTVAETLGTIKETMQGGVTAVKDLFDIPAHVERHPWVMVGGSVALGFMLGNLLARKQVATSPAPLGNRSRQPKRTPSSSSDGWWQSLLPDLAPLKNLALGTLVGTVREMVMKSAPDNVSSELAGIFDSVTAKLGGETVAPPSPQQPQPAMESAGNGRG